MDHIGTVMQWFPKNGFGFIQRTKGADIFLHIKYCSPNFTPQVGQRVRFALVCDERNPTGRADNIRAFNYTAEYTDTTNAGDANNAGDAGKATANTTNVADDERTEWLAEHRGRHANEK